MAAPSRRSTAAWVLYDLANTIFALGVIGLYVPDWLTSAGLPDSALALVEAAAGTSHEPRPSTVNARSMPWTPARMPSSSKRCTWPAS